MKLNEMEVHDRVKLRLPDANSGTIVEMDGELTILTMDAHKRVEFFQVDGICSSKAVTCKVEVHYGPKNIGVDEDFVQFWVDIRSRVPADSMELTVTRVEKKVEI